VSTFILADNIIELEAIQSSKPDLAAKPLILTSLNFSFVHLKQFEIRTYSFFDELLNYEDGIWMSNTVHDFLWTWFLDAEGNDLSSVNGCSLGTAFASSLEILMNSTLRYYVGLRKILSPKDTIYYISKTDKIVRIVLHVLACEIELRTHAIEVEVDQKKTYYGRKKLIMDSIGRYRDLKPPFKSSHCYDRILSVLIPLIQKRSPKKTKRVLLMPAGKLDGYLKHLHEKNSLNEFQFIIPFSRTYLKYFLNRRANQNIRYYHPHAYGNHGISEVQTVIAKLRENIRKKFKRVAPEMLLAVMDHHIFPYFAGANAFYMNCLKILKNICPDLVLLSAEGSESYILMGQAAKNMGFKTAFMPHGGISGWRYKQYRIGRAAVFDYCIGFSRLDAQIYIDQGVKKDRVVRSQFPYYERFIPLKEPRNRSCKTALILPLDIPNISPYMNLRKIHEYIENVIELLIKMNIKPVGLKARNSFVFKHMNIDGDSLKICNLEIPLLSGYSSFPEASAKADIIIGPISTALIEANLMGKDYFAYSDSLFHDKVPSIPSALFRFINVACSIDELRENIRNRKPFKDGYSIFDLVDLRSVKSKEELYQNFENAVINIASIT